MARSCQSPRYRVIRFVRAMAVFLALSAASTLSIAADAEIRLEHPGAVHSVALSPDGTQLVSAGQGGDVLLWDLATKAVAQKLTGHKNPVECVRFIADGHRIATGSWDDTIRIWDVKTGTELASLKGHDGIGVFDVSPNGEQIASAGWSGNIVIWDLKKGSVIRRISTPDKYVRGVAFRDSGRQVVSAGDDEKATLWNAADGRELGSAEGYGYPRSLAASPDGKLIVWGCTNGVIYRWTPSGGAAQSSKGHDSDVAAISFSKDGKVAVSGGRDGAVVLWSVPKFGKIKTIGGGHSKVKAVALSDAGDKFAAGYESGAILVRPAGTGTSAKKFQDPKNRFTFTIIDGWVAADQTETKAAALVYIPSKGFRENLNIMVTEVPDGAREAFESETKARQISAGVNTFVEQGVVGKPQRISISNQFAWKVGYTGVISELKIRGHQWYVIGGKNLYTITWTALKGEDHFEQVEDMVNSLQFSDGAKPPK